MSIGARIKEERERLGMSQEQFAALAQASRKTQIRWEQDSAAPDAAQLAQWCVFGFDAMYVLTGKRPSAPAASDLTAEEQLLVQLYQGCSVTERKRVLQELLGPTKKGVRAGAAKGGISVTGNNNRTAGGDYMENK